MVLGWLPIYPVYYLMLRRITTARNRRQDSSRNRQTDFEGRQGVIFLGCDQIIGILTPRRLALTQPPGEGILTVVFYLCNKRRKRNESWCKIGFGHLYKLIMISEWRNKVA